MTSRSYFGKMNSTLGSVVPLAMFAFIIVSVFVFAFVSVFVLFLCFKPIAENKMFTEYQKTNLDQTSSNLEQRYKEYVYIDLILEV